MNHGVDKTADICTYISLYDICICIILRFCNYVDRIKTKHPDSHMFFGMPRGLQFVRSLFFAAPSCPSKDPDSGLSALSPKGTQTQILQGLVVKTGSIPDIPYVQSEMNLRAVHLLDEKMKDEIYDQDEKAKQVQGWGS